MSSKWRYHHGHHKGRGLTLLRSDEVGHFWTLLEIIFGNDFAVTAANRHYIHADEVDKAFNNVVRFKSLGINLSLIDLNSLNFYINQLFSDEGWKSIRKSINRQVLEDSKQKTHAVASDEDEGVWDYSGVIPSKGKRLKPLSHEELPLCLPIISAYFDDGEVNKEHFRGVNFDENWRFYVMKKGREIKKMIKSFEKQSFLISNGELSTLNLMINSLFSDDGWKLIRQRQAQKKRRTNKNLIELTTETVDNLNSLKSELSLGSYDEAISYLFVESQENPELTKLHHAMEEIGIETYQELIALLKK